MKTIMTRVSGAIIAAAVGLALICGIAGCQDERGNPAGHISDRRFGMTTSNAADTGKDMTLLHGDPRLQTDSLPERINRLQREIAKGEVAYTREELTILERKLAESEEQLRVLHNP